MIKINLSMLFMTTK